MMRSALERLLAGAALGAILVSVGGIAALGATPNLSFYLVGDSVPIGSMSTTSPPKLELPNFDPDRDSEPGLLLAKSSGGVGETDPTRYQQWEVNPGAGNLSISKFVIWGAMKDKNNAKSGLIGVYLLDCGTSCTLLRSQW